MACGFGVFGFRAEHVRPFISRSPKYTLGGLRSSLDVAGRLLLELLVLEECSCSGSRDWGFRSRFAWCLERTQDCAETGKDPSSLNTSKPSGFGVCVPQPESRNPLKPLKPTSSQCWSLFGYPK